MIVQRLVRPSSDYGSQLLAQFETDLRNNSPSLQAAIIDPYLPWHTSDQRLADMVAYSAISGSRTPKLRCCSASSQISLHLITLDL